MTPAVSLFPSCALSQQDDATSVHLDQEIKKIDLELINLRIQQVAYQALGTILTVLSVGFSVVTFFVDLPQIPQNRKYQIIGASALVTLATAYLAFYEKERESRCLNLKNRKETISQLYEQNGKELYESQRKFLGIPVWLPLPSKFSVSQAQYQCALTQEVDRLGENALRELQSKLNYDSEPVQNEDAYEWALKNQDRSEEARNYLFSEAMPAILNYALKKGIEAGKLDPQTSISEIVPAEWSECYKMELNVENVDMIFWVNLQESSFFKGTKKKPIVLFKNQQVNHIIDLKSFFEIFAENKNSDNLSSNFINKFYEKLGL